MYKYLLDRILKHGWDEASEVGTGKFETGIGIDFNHPRFHVFV